jgi:GTP-binding protein EngB required for normal cell division
MDSNDGGPSRDAESLQQFESERKICISSISDLADLTEKMCLLGATKTLRAMKDNLQKGYFHLAVLGGFKRGKSTLVNALIGADVLPTGIIPLTSVLTQIGYGHETQAEVAFDDGRTVAVAVHTLEEYVTERGNPGNRKGVTEVRVFTNSDILRQGVTIVDTPGVGSTYLKNTEVAYGFLSRMDAAVFVMAADPPIGQMELQFLQGVCANVGKVLFVLNKIDSVTESERAESVDFCQSVIKSSLGLKEVRVFPISARMALDSRKRGDMDVLSRSGLLELEKEVRLFLIKGKGREAIRLGCERAMRIASDLSTAIKLEATMLEWPVSKLNTRILQLDSSLEEAKRRIEGLGIQIQGATGQIISRLDNRLQEHKERLEPSLLAALEDFAKNVNPGFGRGEFVKSIEHYVSEALVGAYTPIVLEEEKIVLEEFSQAMSRFERHIDAISDDVREELSRLFILSGHSRLGDRPSVERSRFHFDRIDVLNHGAMLPMELPFILPISIFRRKVMKRARKVLLSELEKHAGKIRYDLDYRLSESARSMEAEMRSRLRLLLEALESASSSARSLREKALREKLERIDELEARESDLQIAVGQLIQVLSEVSPDH